ncbi:MAG: NAD(P)H-dependent glycerol-3-phosphate dehydrogenase [Polyangiales bacterium]
MATIFVAGGGAWGTALACHAARLDHAVTLWAREPTVIADVAEKHENSAFLPRIALPPSIVATSDLSLASSAELIVLVPPAQHLRALAEAVRGYVRDDACLVVASKGMEEHSLRLLSDVLREACPNVGPDRVAFLSGPSFAREVAHGLPTDVVAASEGKTAAHVAQRFLHSPLFRVYTSDDPIGVQVGGAVKNVIAIAAGACDGLRFGNNARAALVTRGLAEITRLGVALGADPLTFLGMAGAGDLFLTCGGDLSRNRTLGLKIAEGIEARAWVESQTSVAEGYTTALAARALSLREGVEMPITEQVHAVLHEGRPLLEAIRQLLTREFKDEQLGLRPRTRT